MRSQLHASGVIPRVQSKFVEVTNQFNWGKFLLCRFTAEEWAYRSKINGASLVDERGWTPRHIWMLDLQTGEGAFFRPGGIAQYDLEKHQIWVCPMFGVFLDELYKHPDWCEDISRIPDLVELSDERAMGASALYGHRRGGPSQEERKRVEKETAVKPKRKRA